MVPYQVRWVERLPALILFCLLLGLTTAQRRIGIQVRLTQADGTALGIERQQVAASTLMALRHVNDRISSIVPAEVVSLLPADFKLAWDVRDTFSSPQVGVRDAVEWTGLEGDGAENPVDSIIGAIRSAVTGPVSLVAHVTHTPVISYWSTSAALSDKAIYPNFARTIPPDSVSAFAMANIVADLGWTSFSVIFIDDLYGVGYSQELASAAGGLGLAVGTAQRYTSGDEESLRASMSTVKQTGVRVVVVIAFASDMTAILRISDELGTSGRGWIWITGDAGDPYSMIENSQDRTWAADQLHGWLQVQPAAFAGENGPRFQSAWFSEPQATFNHSLLGTAPSTGLQATPCPEICGFAYDAVWAAAMAIGRSVPAAGEEMDKERLMGELLAVDFQAATGTVNFDESGDRATAGIAVALFNWQATGEEISIREIGLWYSGAGVVRHVEEVPVWGEAGVEGWEGIPADGASCGPGAIYSDSSLRCTPCARGSVQRGAACEACGRGYHAPEEGMVQCIPCEQGSYADEEGMAACRKCPGNSEVPPGKPQDSEERCECKDGYVVRCRWHVGVLLVLCLGVVLLGLVAWVAALYMRREQKSEEERRVASKMRELREKLRVQEGDGVLLTGESRSVGEWLRRLRRGGKRESQHRLNPKCLESAARLALFLDFDAEAFNMLYIYMLLLDAEKAKLRKVATARRALSRRTSRLRSFYHTAMDSIMLGHMPSALNADNWDGDRMHSGALCELLLDVSRKLLNPWEQGAHGDDGRRLSLASGSGSFYGMLEGGMDSPEERFNFFTHRLAKLRLWQDFDHFERLKFIAQGFMDELRAQCDRQYEQILLEDQGQALVHFGAVPSASVLDATDPVPIAPAGLAVPGPSSQEEAVPVAAPYAPPLVAEEVQDVAAMGMALGGVLGVRQDSQRVQAIRLDAQDWKEIALQLQSADGSEAASGSNTPPGRGSALPDRSPNPPGAGGLSVSCSPMQGASSRDAAVLPHGVRQRGTVPPLGSALSLPDDEDEGGSRRPSCESQGSSRAGAWLQRLTPSAFSSKHPKRDKDRLDDYHIRSMASKYHAAHNVNPLNVDEEVYISHLHQRAVLLNDGFQKKIRVFVGKHLLQDGQRPPPASHFRASHLKMLNPPPPTSKPSLADILSGRPSSASARSLPRARSDGSARSLPRSLSNVSWSSSRKLFSSLLHAVAPPRADRADLPPRDEESRSSRFSAADGGIVHAEASAPSRASVTRVDGLPAPGAEGEALDRPRVPDPPPPRALPYALRTESAPAPATSPRPGPGEAAIPDEEPPAWRRHQEQDADAELWLAASESVEVHDAPIKTKVRMRAKVKCYQEEGLVSGCSTLPLSACILDPVRASVVCDGPRSILQHVAWFLRSGEEEGLPVLRIKNKFAVRNSSEYDGYRDLMLSVLYTGAQGLRIIGEVQLHDRRMYALKVKMHKLYKVKRAASAEDIQDGGRLSR